MAKFRTASGDVIETEHPAVINDYRHRAEFEEITDARKTKKTAKSQPTAAADAASTDEA